MPPWSPLIPLCLQGTVYPHVTCLVAVLGDFRRFYEFFFQRSFRRTGKGRPLGLGWPRRARSQEVLPMSPLASTINVMLSKANITTVDAFAHLLLSSPTFIANYVRSEAAAAAVAGRHADKATMADVAVLNVGTQTVLMGDVVETSVAEAMIAEALCMLDAAQERERLADERARSWEVRAELATTLLKAAEVQTDRAQADRLAAERLVAAEHAAMEMAVQLLAAEAALADAAVERALHEGAVRAPAEAQRDIWRALAGGRGGRGGRGRHGHPHPPPPPSPPQPPQPSQPPPPPPLAELIVLVLAVPIETEGQMTAEEALSIFNVTHRSPRWLLAQVHPDKHPHHTSKAEAATARVNQARDIRSRHVADWTQ